MHMRALALAALLIGGCASPGAAPPVQAARPPVVQADAIDAAAAAFSAKTGISNMSLLLMKGEEVLYRKDFGSYGPETMVPIASATKWLVGSAVMTLVDAGRLNLEDPIRTWLPELPAPYGGLSLGQLLSYTAGTAGLNQGGLDVRQDRTLSLEAAALELAQRPLADTPGRSFAYGGADFQFVGAVVERVTGKRWSDVFDETLAKPLGMNKLSWSNPQGPNPAASVRNPLLQGGAFVSLDAYAPLLTMLAQDGVYKGRRYLSERAIRDMERTRTRGLTMRYVPPGATATSHYSIAHWCETGTDDGPGGRCAMLSSPGAFGVYPWIDRTSGLHGVIYVQDSFNRIAADERVLREAMIAAVR
jgi:CubicO group peptidase (beta-lactamase class C family)